MKITLHEKSESSPIKESNELVFLPENLKETLDFKLPSLYRADSLAIFKGSEEIDPDVAWDIEDLSWDVDEATTSGEYLMVGFKNNPGEDSVKSIMADEYKKAVLPEALELIAYLDVSALRNAYSTQIVDATEGKPWELGYYMGDISDMGDVPGGIDNAYTESGATVAISAFNIAIADSKGSEIKYTKSVDEALKILEDIYNKEQA